MIKIKGMQGFKKGIGVVRNRIATQNRRSLYKAIVTVEAESARRTPVDTGALRGSGLGNGIVYKSDEKGAEGLFYYTANYAVHVHEITKNRHEVGEAKYMENAIKNKAGEVRGILGQDYKAVISRSV